MVRFFLRRQIAKNRDMLLSEATAINGFMQLLMKPVNTGEQWSRGEKAELRSHLQHLAALVPVLLLFLLPGGSLLLPLLAEILDRRKKKRAPGSESQPLKKMQND